MQKTRLILCCNCESWKACENVELGTCRLKQENDITENTTWYNTRCIYGLSEKIN